jgi:hypothetical protein
MATPEGFSEKSVAVSRPLCAAHRLLLERVTGQPEPFGNTELERQASWQGGWGPHERLDSPLSGPLGIGAPGIVRGSGTPGRPRRGDAMAGKRERPDGCYAGRARALRRNLASSRPTRRPSSVVGRETAEISSDTAASGPLSIATSDQLRSPCPDPQVRRRDGSGPIRDIGAGRRHSKSTGPDTQGGSAAPCQARRPSPKSLNGIDPCSDRSQASFTGPSLRTTDARVTARVRYPSYEVSDHAAEAPSKQ